MVSSMPWCIDERLVKGEYYSQVGDCVTVGGSGAFGELFWAAQILDIPGPASTGLLSLCLASHVAAVMPVGSCLE